VRKIKNIVQDTQL